MTKAERIFNDTRYECLKHITTWGYEVNPDGTACGFSGLIHKDTELICMRTIKDITKILASKRKFLKTCEKLGKPNEREAQILNMVESTLHNCCRKMEESK